MKVALLSDIHDNTDNLLVALAMAKQQHCTHLLFAGDMTTLATFHLLLEEWGYGIDLVFGNNEFDREFFLRTAEYHPRVTHHGDIADLTLDSRRIFMTHYPQAAAKAVQSGLYDAVFFGHSHRAMQQTDGSTLVANPGEIDGVRYAPSYAVYCTETNSLTHFPLA